MHDDVPQPRFQAFRLHKRGNSEAECEDACAANEAAGHFAIADGASESAFADLWARLLVEQFVHNPVAGPRRWTSWLKPLRQKWVDEVSQRPLPWYVEAKVQEGAFAAFLGLSVSNSHRRTNQRWRAVAVGDSCLFLIRAGQLQHKFPLGRADEFGNCPSLIGARDQPLATRKKHRVQRTQGDWQAGDRIWLMTDALAEWFLRQAEESRRPWTVLDRLLAGCPTAETFASWVEDRRDNEKLRNDDVTLVAVSLESPA
jgi:hypothetical protein